VALRSAGFAEAIKRGLIISLSSPGGSNSNWVLSGMVSSDQILSGLCNSRAVVVRNVSGAKAETYALMEAVQSGSEVIIGKAGKPADPPGHGRPKRWPARFQSLPVSTACRTIWRKPSGWRDHGVEAPPRHPHLAVVAGGQSLAFRAGQIEDRQTRKHGLRQRGLALGNPAQAEAGQVAAAGPVHGKADRRRGSRGLRRRHPPGPLTAYFATRTWLARTMTRLNEWYICPLEAVSCENRLRCTTSPSCGLPVTMLVTS